MVAKNIANTCSTNKKSKTNEMNHKFSFSSLTYLKISDHLQDQCRPFQKIRLDELDEYSESKLFILMNCLL